MRRIPSHFYLKDGINMKILILRFSSMGDILLATPVPDVLKLKYPDAEIDWVVNAKFSEVLKNNSHVSRIIKFSTASELKEIRKDIKVKHYDLIFDLHKNLRSFYLTAGLKNVFRYDKRTLDRFLLVRFKKKYKKIIPATQMYFRALNKAGISTPEKWNLTYNINEETENRIARKYDLKDKKYIIFVPGASYRTKMWPVEYFKRTAAEFLNDSYFNGYRIFIIGRGELEELAGKKISEELGDRCVDLTGILDLDESAAVLKNSELVVTNDNGPMHLAECFKKKIIAIFGCTTEQLGFFPYSTDYTVIQNNDLKCRPCTHFGRKKCPEDHFKCMNEIEPVSVFDKIKEFLK
jgi:lipopolysaccharide heptosyltransferase II